MPQRLTLDRRREFLRRENVEGDRGEEELDDRCKNKRGLLVVLEGGVAAVAVHSSLGLLP